MDVNDITFGDLNDKDIVKIVNHYIEFENFKTLKSFDIYSKMHSRDDVNCDDYNELLSSYEDVVSEYEKLESHKNDLEDMLENISNISNIFYHVIRNNLNNIEITDILREPLNGILSQGTIDTILRAKKLKVAISGE